VGNEDVVPHEVGERLDDVLDGRLARHHRGVDAGDLLDDRRDVLAGVDERRVPVDDPSGVQSHRADLGDLGAPRHASRRLEVDDAVRDVPDARGGPG